MPLTVCAACGGQFHHPADWYAHLLACAPARQKEAATALRGLALSFQTQAKVLKEVNHVVPGIVI